MAEAAIGLLTTKLSMFSAVAMPASPDQRCDYIAPTLSKRSYSISSVSSTSSTNSVSSSTHSSYSAEETELQPWNYSRREPTAQDEVERKKSELGVRRAREAEGVWREFWH